MFFNLSLSSVYCSHGRTAGEVPCYPYLCRLFIRIYIAFFSQNDKNFIQ